MARSLNKVSLIGNVGREPEIRSTSSGTRVASFSVATSRQWKDKSGSPQEKTEWHRCQAWGKLAEIIEQFVNKGDRLYLEGRIEYGEYEKDGVKRYTTDINVQEMVMLGGEGPRASAGQGTPAAASAGPPVGDDLPFAPVRLTDPMF